MHSSSDRKAILLAGDTSIHSLPAAGALTASGTQSRRSSRHGAHVAAAAGGAAGRRGGVRTNLDNWAALLALLLALLGLAPVAGDDRNAGQLLLPGAVVLGLQLGRHMARTRVLAPSSQPALPTERSERPARSPAGAKLHPQAIASNARGQANRPRQAPPRHHRPHRKNPPEDVAGLSGTPALRTVAGCGQVPCRRCVNAPRAPWKRPWSCAVLASPPSLTHGAPHRTMAGRHRIRETGSPRCCGSSSS
jgi:hypothetical protein